MSAVATTSSSALATVSQRALDFINQNRAAKGEFSDGIGTGFSVLSYRGKVWRVKHGGEETVLMRNVEGQDEAATTVEMILVKPGAGLSKNYYASGFVEGSNEKPDCYSSNGIKPEQNSPNIQSPTCASCKWNVFGSRISTDGTGKGKACADSKRMAVVPGRDIDNERFGGPMLMRVPAASLKELAQFERTMNAGGYPLMGIVVRISFDPTVAHPQLKFTPVRTLTDQEVDQVIALRDDARTRTILETTLEHDEAPSEAKPDVASMFEQPPEPKTGTSDAAKAVADQAAKDAEAARAAKAAQDKAKADQKAAIKAKADAEAARLQAELDAKEAADAKAAEPEEDEDERELRLAQERVAAKKAAKAKAEADAKAAATTTAAKPQETKPAVEDADIVSEDTKAAAPTGIDDFDAMLDNMLS